MKNINNNYVAKGGCHNFTPDRSRSSIKSFFNNTWTSYGFGFRPLVIEKEEGEDT